MSFYGSNNANQLMLTPPNENEVLLGFKGKAGK
jgi:hypothetical protein